MSKGNTNWKYHDKEREISDKTRKLLSEAAKGNTNWVGRKHTDKTRKLISKIKKDNFKDPNYRERHHMWYNGSDPDDGVVMLSPYSHRMGHAFLRACGVKVKRYN